MEEIKKYLIEIREAQVMMSVKQDRNTALLNKHAELLDKSREEQVRQNETLLRNTITVEEHHRRSLALEKQIARVETEIEPIKAHVQQLTGVGKFFRMVGYVAGAIAGTIGLVKLLSIFVGS